MDGALVGAGAAAAAGAFVLAGAFVPSARADKTPDTTVTARTKVNKYRFIFFGGVFSLKCLLT
jgi:hypothetical protein